MRLIMLSLLLACYATSSAQIFSESFTAQNGYGIVGPCGAEPSSCEVDSIPAPSGWIISGDASQMLASTDWFMVTNERLEARDLGAEMCYESGYVDISTYDSVNVSIDISEIGDHEASDYIDIYIVVDGDSIFQTAWIGVDSNHTIVGDFPTDADWGDTTFIRSGFSGDTLQFIICVKNNSGTEIIRFDNIRVENGDTTGPPAPMVYINELDCDQAGSDMLEFIELAGPPGQSLDSFVLVLFNGNGDVSYAAHALDGFALDDAGFFTICFGSNNSEYCTLNVGGSIQNGTDGVGLYYGKSIEDFPNGTPVQSAGLVDGLRYSTGNDGIDDGLAMLDTDPDCAVDDCQIDENALGSQETHSIQRGSWFVGPPTPGGVNSTPLPVELVSFDVLLRSNIAELAWTTVWEVHNDYFAIEHSLDGHWYDEIGLVSGAHSSRGMLRYDFSHSVIAKGRHYYRLRQVDEDGSFEYSPIRVVMYRDSKISVTPTMTHGAIDIQWPQNTRVDIYVFSVQGALLYAENSSVGYTEISLRAMQPGMYIVIVDQPLHKETFKVLRI